MTLTRSGAPLRSGTGGGQIIPYWSVRGCHGRMPTGEPERRLEAAARRPILSGRQARASACLVGSRRRETVFDDLEDGSPDHVGLIELDEVTAVLHQVER